MPKLAEDEAAEHGRDRERHAGDRADHPVGAVAPVLGDEEGHARRHGDAAHHPGDGSGRGWRPRGSRTRGRSSWSSSSASTATKTMVASPKHSGGQRRGQHHRGVLAVVVDVGAEGGADGGRRDAVRAADHTGGHDGAGLQVHPEGEREPQERARDARHQRVEQQLLERRPCPPWTRGAAGSSSPAATVTVVMLP